MEADRGPWRDLLEHIREEIHRIAMGDEKLAVQIRRYVSKQLMYDERGTPVERREKKVRLYERQKGLCALCSQPLELKRSELHRTHDSWRG
jgi:pyruvate-formate lyase-activating enzyme